MNKIRKKYNQVVCVVLSYRMHLHVEVVGVNYFRRYKRVLVLLVKVTHEIGDTKLKSVVYVL